MIAARGFFILLSSLLSSLFFLLFALPVHAQLDLPHTENSVFITVAPEHPKPSEAVKVYAQSVYYDLTKSYNTWTVGGKVVAQGTGVVEATFTAGALGSRNTVVFDADTDTGTATARASIVPTEIDLLFESDSLVPPFYRGRALPTEGTSVRLLAIPRFERTDGTFVSLSSLNYTWKRNGSIVASASGKGKSVALLPSPVLFGTDTITVDIATIDGTLAGSASVSISSTKPLLLLYQDSSLFGIMYHKPLGTETSASESEATFTAMPFFANAANPNDTSLNYDWTVAGQHITSDPARKSAVTISSSGRVKGRAPVHLDLSMPENLFFSTQGDWGISFSAASRTNEPGTSANNPFLPQ